MRRALTLCAGAAIVAAVFSLHLRLSAAALQGPPGATGRLVLAVLRNDSLLLPFAAFDGRKWSTPWPDGIGGPGAPDLPVSLGSVPVKWWGGEEPGAWKLWTRGADTASPLGLQSLAMIPVGIGRQLGIRTDRAPVLPPVPPFVLPYPKVGLAIAGDASLRPIATVSALTDQWKAFAAALRQEVDKAEEKSIRALHGGANWEHPFRRELRAKVAAELEAWYVTRLPGSSINLSYMEAAKKYPLLPADQGCGLETFVSGWVHHEDGLKNLHATLKAVITYCDRRSVSYMLPFGELQLAGKPYWVAQMSGRDHEWYTVIEARTDEVKYVAEYQAGFVPQR
jgi:hypothetical protein